MKIYFSDYFEVDSKTIDDYGAFNISLIADLPLFIDPFLIFNSKKEIYKKLHADIIGYLSFLRDKSSNEKDIENGLIMSWYKFSEVKNTWLGYSGRGNRGRGLGKKFANELHLNLHEIFSNFGSEDITSSSHLEKLCLVSEGVGRDNISDFTTNLIKGFLLNYTQEFAQKYINDKYLKIFNVDKVNFNYNTETWESKKFNLPFYNDDFVILVPKNLLTKDDLWINKKDLYSSLEYLPTVIPNEQLRAQINNYFRKLLPKKIKKADVEAASALTFREFPVLIDYYIKYKEKNADEAVRISRDKVEYSKQLYLDNFKFFSDLLSRVTDFYKIKDNTYEEALKRVGFMKDVIENKGGHKLFWVKNVPIRNENDLHILFRLTWYQTPSDVTREANDGRGSADFKISRGAPDKSIIEFKLASNSKLKQNLLKQVEIYKAASDAKNAIKVIMCFTEDEEIKVKKLLSELKLAGKENIILIDARNDNKPSGSVAK